MTRPIPRLRKDQRAIANSKARFKVVACGRRWGKTVLGLVMAIEAARRGKRVWWVTPNYGMAFYPWRDLKATLQNEWIAKNESARHIDLEGGGSITVKSADEPDSLRGVGLDLLIIDEAAFVKEEAWTHALRPALSDRKGRVLLISTPRGQNWFWHLYQRGVDPLHPDWEAWTAPASANPIIDDDEIAEAKSLLAERVFRQEYLAEFLESGGTVFSKVRQAADAPSGSAPQPDHTYLMGVDFGRYEDMTAAAVIDRDTGQMVALDRFNEIDWQLQRDRLAALARAWRVETIHAEANAMGEPNIEALRQAGLDVEAFVTTRLSKATLIEGLVKAIQEREIHLLPDEVLIGELESYAYTYTSSGTSYGAPPGRHDDTVIALALAWKLAIEPRLVFGMVEI